MKRLFVLLILLTILVATISDYTLAASTDPKVNQEDEMNQEFPNSQIKKEGYPEYEGLQIKEIKVIGATRTKESILKRLTGLREKDFFSNQQIKLVEARLKEIGSLANISLLPELDGSGKVNIYIYVQEGGNFARVPTDYIGLALDSLINTRLSLTYYNLNGRLINLTGIWGFKKDEENANNHEKTLKLQGAIFPTLPINSTLAISKYDTYRHLQWGDYSGSTYRFNHQALDLSNELLLSSNSRLQVNLRYLKDELTSLNTTLSPFLIETGDYIEIHTSIEKITPPTDHLGSYNTVNHLKIGLLMDLDEELQTYPYFTVKSKKAIPLNPKWILALEGNLGWMDKSMPFHRQFVFGGPETFSAYPQGLIGNRYLFLGTELRYFLMNDLQITAELNGGKVLQGDEPYQFNDPLVCIGGFIRYKTPLGIILKTGYAIDPLADQKEFVFGGTTDF